MGRAVWPTLLHKRLGPRELHSPVRSGTLWTPKRPDSAWACGALSGAGSGARPCTCSREPCPSPARGRGLTGCGGAVGSGVACGQKGSPGPFSGYSLPLPVWSPRPSLPLFTPDRLLSFPRGPRRGTPISEAFGKGASCSLPTRPTSSRCPQSPAWLKPQLSRQWSGGSSTQTEHGEVRVFF